jgi:hypothetical protein
MLIRESTDMKCHERHCTVDRRRSAQTTRADAHNSGHLASVQLWRQNAALDGEIVAVDRKGKPRFNDLMLLTQDKKEHLLGYILILQDDYRKVTFLNCLTGHGGGSGEPVAPAV